MALSRGTKIGIGVGLGALALFALSGTAKAKPTIFVPGTPEPPTDDNIPPPVGPPPPKPAPNHACNYLGCPGFKPSRAKYTETYAALRLQQLGYAINPAVANFSLLTAYNMGIVAQFQRDANHVRKGLNANNLPQGWGLPAPLDPDGLFGNFTATWVELAHTIVAQRIQAWKNIVALSPP